jgi:hypothetical protein
MAGLLANLKIVPSNGLLLVSQVRRGRPLWLARS